MEKFVIPSVGELLPYNGNQGTMVQIGSLIRLGAWCITGAGEGNINGNQRFFPPSIFVLPFVNIFVIVLIRTKLAVNFLPLSRSDVSSLESLVTQNIQQCSKVALRLLDPLIPIPISKLEGRAIGIWMVSLRVAARSSEYARFFRGTVAAWYQREVSESDILFWIMRWRYRRAVLAHQPKYIWARAKNSAQW
jgi:hypothetical protein